MPTRAPAERYLWGGVTTCPPHLPIQPLLVSTSLPSQGGGCNATPRGAARDQGAVVGGVAGGVHPSAAPGAALPPGKRAEGGGTDKAAQRGC